MNIDILINMVSDAMDATQSYLAFCSKIRSDCGLPPKASIWIPSLSGNDAYRLGELCERSNAEWSSVAQVCRLLEIDQNLLVATVKSINRWEAHGGLYDRSLCLEIKGVKDRVMRFLSEKNKEKQHYKSTGRLKSWCVPENKRLCQKT